MRVKKTQKWVEWSVFRKTLFVVSAIFLLCLSYVYLDNILQEKKLRDEVNKITDSSWVLENAEFDGMNLCIDTCANYKATYSAKKNNRAEDIKSFTNDIIRRLDSNYSKEEQLSCGKSSSNKNINYCTISHLNTKLKIIISVYVVELDDSLNIQLTAMEKKIENH
jgi:hypothetical protein